MWSRGVGKPAFALHRPFCFTGSGRCDSSTGTICWYAQQVFRQPWILRTTPASEIPTPLLGSWSQPTGCDAQDLALVSNATTGLSAVFASLQLEDDDVVLILDTAYGIPNLLAPTIRSGVLVAQITGHWHGAN